ncbi:sortase [Candidatus Dojkabacteria bacterium]|uniref:Sortase n=1 Tax=Candidatus Dojkabacteria bacterium TaxID=2099670 RepID=A0A3M0YZE0_9BACT|nr:MAG: sortase [Candidatus Dojkabacteria bacterium]
MDDETRLVGQKSKNPLKLKSILSDIYNELKDASQSPSGKSNALPLLMIFTGVLIILFQFRTDLIQFVNHAIGSTNQGNISPVSDNFLSIESYISVPTGITELTDEVRKKKLLQVDDEALAYNQPFYISIPSIGLNRLIVKPNVESTTERVYREVLENSLAHFKNTGLPFTKIKNNTVIYGHSASQTFNPKRNDPRVAFSFLPEVKIGDKILVDINRETYEFTIYRTKVVNPDDISIITGTPETKTLTLFTCYPIGNNTQRYVVIARKS